MWRRLYDYHDQELAKYISSKYNKLQKKKISKRRYIKLLKRYRNDFLHRGYPFLKEISYELAHKLICDQKYLKIVTQTTTNSVNKFEGFQIEEVAARYYPLGTMLAHILGNVGSVTQGELKNRAKDYRRNDLVGRQGMERILENVIKGSRGCIVAGKQGDHFVQPASDGKDVFLTINAKAQQVAEKELDLMVGLTESAQGGAAVVIEVTTGDIIVIATSPRYDANHYRKNYKELLKDPTRPLENRALYNKYPAPPGSIFKTIVALYALEHKYISSNTIIHCRGFLHNPKAFRCTHVHGATDVIKSIEGSCNVFYYVVGEKIGAKGLEECARLFGFGEKSHLGLRKEYRGYIPTLKNSRGIWNKGDSRMLAIGQRLTATPFQVARAMCMIANRGIMPMARIVKETRAPNTTIPKKIEEIEGRIEVSREISKTNKKVYIMRKWPIRQKNWNLVSKGMYRVVEGRHGTAKNIRRILKGLEICSKTVHLK